MHRYLAQPQAAGGRRPRGRPPGRAASGRRPVSVDVAAVTRGPLRGDRGPRGQDARPRPLRRLRSGRGPSAAHRAGAGRRGQEGPDAPRDLRARRSRPARRPEPRGGGGASRGGAGGRGPGPGRRSGRPGHGSTGPASKPSDSASWRGRGSPPGRRWKPQRRRRARRRRRLRAAEFAVRNAEHELDRGEGAARRAQAAGEARATLELRSPIDGVVLTRVQQSEAVLPAGTPLLELGASPRPRDRRRLPVDRRGQDQAGRPGVHRAVGRRPVPSRGRVRRVEPSGFLKVSALGVEEQRVNVIVDFTGSTRIESDSATATESRFGS